MAGPAYHPEKIPDQEQLKKFPPKKRRCLGCNNGYVWDQKRNRKLKCTACKGKGLI